MSLLSYQPEITATRGFFYANVKGATNHFFNADDAKLHLFKNEDNVWTISVEQVISPVERYLFYIVLPSNFADDGKQHNFPFGSTEQPDQAVGQFRADGPAYHSVNGEIRVSLKNGRMKATFNFAANNGAGTIIASQGHLDLQTAHGKFTAAFTDYPLPTPSFNANVLSIEKNWDWVGGCYYYLVIGEQTQALPPNRYRLSIQVYENVTLGKHKLGNDAFDVGIVFADLNGLGIMRAYDGILTLTGLPKSGHAKGSFNCSMLKPDGKVFKVKGNFNVREPLPAD